jgi:hypothetical protein
MITPDSEPNMIFTENLKNVIFLVDNNGIHSDFFSQNFESIFILIVLQLNPFIIDRSVQSKPFVITGIRYKCSHGLCIKNLSFSWKYKIYKVSAFKIKLICFAKYSNKSFCSCDFSLLRIKFSNFFNKS